MFLSPFFFVAQKFLPSDFPKREDYFFARALENAQFAMGSTHPNPSVGAVLTKDDEIIAEGFTHQAGGAHAEKHALALALEKAKDATLFVTLEPCCHFGKTPPCTDAIIAAGIKRVIFGAFDPNPAVHYKGVETLRRAGIFAKQIDHAQLRTLATMQIRPFATWMEKKRPYIVAKLASSVDEKIAFKEKRIKITSSQSDVVVHELRRAVDAVVVGKNTVCIDNPRLTARLGRENHTTQPIRVVLSRDLTGLDDNAHVFDHEAKTKVITSFDRDRKKEQQLLTRGVEVLISAVEMEHKKIHLLSAFTLLADQGITAVLVEPGLELFSSLMATSIPDEVWWFRSKMTVGEDGLLIPVREMLLSAGYELHHQQPVGDDDLLVYLRSLSVSEVGESGGEKNRLTRLV